MLEKASRQLEMHVLKLCEYIHIHSTEGVNMLSHSQPPRPPTVACLHQHNPPLCTEQGLFLAGAEVISPADAATGSTQLTVLSKMNEQLASENAALIAELAKVERQQTRQAIQKGRQREFPALVAGIPAKTLESLLSLPGTAAAATADQPSSAASTVRQLSSVSTKGCNEKTEPDNNLTNVAEGFASTLGTAWVDTHSSLQQRAQQLDAQIELTQLRSEIETLKAEVADAAAQALTKQGLIHTLQRQLSAADSQHQQEIKELKRAAKQAERRSEQLAQQPNKADDSSVQVCRCTSCHDGGTCLLSIFAILSIGSNYMSVKHCMSPCKQGVNIVKAAKPRHKLLDKEQHKTSLAEVKGPSRRT